MAVATVLEDYESPGELWNQIECVQRSGYEFAESVQTYCDDRGEEEDLVMLAGFIDVSYQRSMNSVNLEIYFPKDYPKRFPHVFVRSQGGSWIERSAYIDETGRVNLPQCGLGNQHTVLDILQTLQHIFGNNFPYGFSSSSQDPLAPPLVYGSSPSYYPSAAPPTGAPKPQPPPPQPPAPISHPLFSKVTSLLEARRAAVTQLQGDEAELLRREHDVEQRQVQLSAEIAAARDNLAAYQNYLSSIKIPPEPSMESVDEVVQYGTPLHTQAAELTAEDQTISECLLHLGFALQSEAMDLSTYLRQVRVLGSRQFQVRFLLKRVQALLPA